MLKQGQKVVTPRSPASAVVPAAMPGSADGRRWESLEEIEHPAKQEHKEWNERAVKVHGRFTPASSSATPTTHLKLSGRRGAARIEEEICRFTARLPRNSILR
jgi:hypothetical protein